MARRGAPSFLKRQKEQQRTARAAAKRAARQAQRESRRNNAGPDFEGEPMLDAGPGLDEARPEEPGGPAPEPDGDPAR